LGVPPFYHLTGSGPQILFSIVIANRALRKTRESANICGSYGGLKIAILAYFGLFYPENLNSDFGFFNADRQSLGPNRDSENLKKIAIPRFQKNALKLEKKRIFDFEYFRVAGGLSNGVMVTTPRDSSVTVRDRPPNVLGSNRKLGSKSPKIGSPPYFYFRFGR